MPARESDRSRAWRHRLFVGRDAELTYVDALLDDPDRRVRALFVHGPGGVGKSMLLSQLARRGEAQGRRVALLTGPFVEPSADAIATALTAAAGRPRVEPATEDLAGALADRLVLVDDYEELLALDGWFREELVGRLPDRSLLVLAGRLPPSVEWRADPRWRELIEPLALRNLDPSDSRHYLLRRGVDEDDVPAVLQFTHGHPLALALVADSVAQRPGARFAPTSAPDVVKALLEQLVQEVPGPAHRAALEACALVAALTESLLAEMLATDDAYELFEWVRGLSFVDAGPVGLGVHEVAREAIVSDLRWRNPEWYAELHARARAAYLRRLPTSTGPGAQRLLFDYISLHRDNPVVRPVFDWRARTDLVAGPARPADEDTIVDLVARHEGAASAALARRWLDRQPGGVRVLRRPDGAVAGFLIAVAMDDTDVEDAAADPAVAAAGAHLRLHAPLRPGDTATLFRFWMVADTYQAVSAEQSLLFVEVVRHYLSTPRLVFTYFPCAEPERWREVFGYALLRRVPEADFTVSGRRFGVYGHDWRARPPAVWLDVLAERETTPTTPASPPDPGPTVVVLSEADFAAAVRDALRRYRRPDTLADNPLLQSRLVLDRVGTNSSAGARAGALLEMIAHAATLLDATPRSTKLHRALHHTYLQPAASQERAAELLGLPFSTYRRHLRQAIAQVTETLWQQELGEGAPAVRRG